MPSRLCCQARWWRRCSSGQSAGPGTRSAAIAALQQDTGGLLPVPVLAMIHVNTPVRPGVTAIAALLAFSSTPALAQAIAADPAAGQAPAAGPPAPDGTPPSAAVPAVQAQPVAAPSTTPDLPDLPVVAAEEPKPAPAGAKASVPVARKAAADAQPASPRWTVTPARPAAAPAPALPAVADATEPAAPAPAATEPALAEPAESPGWLPIGGGLLVLAGGAALAVTRRRRKSMMEPRLIDEPVVFRPMARVPAPAPAPKASPAMRAPAAPSAPRPATAPTPARRKGDQKNVLEAMVAQPPSPENPFVTRKLRLRQARFLLRTGQAPAVVPETSAPPRVAPDRWSEMRIAGQSPVRIHWRPLKG
jgi:hypothetical protein